jgi:hypothetical protein
MSGRRSSTSDGTPSGCRRILPQRSGRHPEIRGRRAAQHRQRVLVVRAQLPLQSGLRAGGLQQRLLLRQVQTGGDSAIVTVLDQRRGLLDRSDCIVQNANLRIHLAKREEVGGGLRGQHQSYVLEVRAGGLVRRIGGFHAAPRPSEKIRLVTQHER